MGLNAKTWFKNILRTDPRFMKHMSHEKKSRAWKGPNIEPDYKVVVVELMLHVRKLVPGCQGIAMFAKRWRDLVASTIGRFPDAETFIFPFDDDRNVPRAKGETQAQRKKNRGFTPEELEALGEFRFLCNSNTEGFDDCVLAMFSGRINKITRKPRPAFGVFMEKYFSTGSLREDNIEFATRWIIAGDYVGLGKARRIVVDGGVWRHSFERDIQTDLNQGRSESWKSVKNKFNDFRVLRQRIDPAYTRQELDPASRAMIMIDHWGVRKVDQMDQTHIIGEADLKIPRYVRLMAGRKHIYIDCSDTDLLAILLLMIRDIIPKTGKMLSKVTLNVTTSTDEHPKRPRPRNPSTDPEDKNYWVAGLPPLPPKMGVVDMVGLWREIHKWYAVEFPTIRNPVESFVLYLIMVGTDYIKNPPRLGEKLLWKAYHDHCLGEKILADLIHTDGRIGTAWIEDDAEAHLLLDIHATDSKQDATARIAKLFSRSCDGWGMLAKGNTNKGVPSRFRKHISLNERLIERWLTMAYVLVKNNKDPTTDQWKRSQARRIGWQIAYWSGGDTLAGRQYEDEMIGITQDITTKRIITHRIAETGQSLHGWNWIKNDDAVDSTPPKKRAREYKNHTTSIAKQGDLKRFKPHDYSSTMATIVVELPLFRQAMLTAKQKKS